MDTILDKPTPLPKLTVCFQIQLVLENHKARLQALRMLTKKMLFFKVACQRSIILKPLVILSLLFANVTLVVLFVQMLIQKIDVVKSFRAAKFANRMPVKAGSRPVSLFQMVLELTRSEPRQLGNEIALVIDAQLTHR